MENGKLMKFSEFLAQEDFNLSLSEALIVLTKDKLAEFGNVVIMAGGAGTGKGFVVKNLLQIRGKILDVDALKTAALKSKKIQGIVKTELGLDLSEFDSRNPEDVRKLHQILSVELKLNNKQQQALFSSIITAAPDRKPNLIFDVTLKDMYKLYNITDAVKQLGYSPENIHIVYVVNDIEVAKAQNKTRDRVVPEEILLSTTLGSATTMKIILDMGKELQKHMDGAIVVSFNQVGVDTKSVKTDDKHKYVEYANYVFVKHQGKPQISSKELSQEVIQKLSKYIPDVW